MGNVRVLIKKTKGSVYNNLGRSTEYKIYIIVINFVIDDIFHIYARKQAI